MNWQLELRGRQIAQTSMDSQVITFEVLPPFTFGAVRTIHIPPPLLGLSLLKILCPGMESPHQGHKYQAMSG